MYVYACLYTYTYTYMHVYTYVYVYIYMYIHVYRSKGPGGTGWEPLKRVGGSGLSPVAVLGSRERLRSRSLHDKAWVMGLTDGRRPGNASVLEV